MATRYAAATASDASILTSRRIADAAAGVIYTKADVELSHVKVKVNDDKTISVHVTDDTKLYFKPIAGAPPYEEWSIGRTFTFGGSAANPELLSEAEDDATGPAETTDVQTTGLTPNPAGAPGSASTVRPSGAASAPMVATASTGYYNYTAMVNFEVAHWNGEPSGDASMPGDDCTNFLSYALQAGGWTMVGKQQVDSSNDGQWYINYLPPVWNAGGYYVWSHSWAVADDWNTFARNSGRVTALSNVWYTSLADVIQAKWPGYTTIQHSMMVTAVDSNGGRYMAYHTNNTLNRPLIDIINTNPGTTWYADRT